MYAEKNDGNWRRDRMDQDKNSNPIYSVVWIRLVVNASTIVSALAGMRFATRVVLDVGYSDDVSSSSSSWVVDVGDVEVDESEGTAEE